MKLVEKLPLDKNHTKNHVTDDTFFEQMQPEVFGAVCRGLDVLLYPIVLVSKQLMVLKQTTYCQNLLGYGTFYSIADVLPPLPCEMISKSIEQQETYTISVLMQGDLWNMRIIPVEENALLIFQNEVHHQVGVSKAAADLRENVMHLLQLATQLENKEQQALRREAMRILRQANHMELLSGAPESFSTKYCSVREVLTHAQQQMQALGVTVNVKIPKQDFYLWLQEEKLLSALMTLISNSLRYGGEDVTVSLYAKKNEHAGIFCVDDMGKGLDEQALLCMNDTWRKADAMIGSWGLGIPYARRIAELHGGALMFTHKKDCGCAARLLIPFLPPEESGMQAGNEYEIYLASDGNPAEIELSNVLQADAFRIDQ